MPALLNGSPQFLYKCTKCDGNNWRAVVHYAMVNCDFCGHKFVSSDVATKEELNQEAMKTIKERVDFFIKMLNPFRVHIRDDFAVFDFDLVFDADKFFNFCGNREPLCQGLEFHQKNRSVAVISQIV